MKTLLIRFVLAVLGVMTGAQAARACSCMMPGPPCQAYFEADAVFVGTVKSITTRQVNESSIERLLDRRLVRISVERASRGVQGQEVDVWTGLGGGDCGFDFKVGERYVVYAHRRPTDGALGTGICSRTRLAGSAEAADDLRYLASPPASGRGAQISGVVKHQERDTSKAEPGAIQHGPVPDVQVLVRGAAGVFSGMSRDDGRYVIDGVPPGRYELDVLPPPSFSTRDLQRKFEIKDARACRVEDVFLHYNGRIAGRVVGADGQPVPDIRLDVAPAVTPDQPLSVDSASLKTDGNGFFELSDLSPGRYVVGVEIRPNTDPQVVYGRTLYAEQFDVGAGTRVDAGTLRLPKPAARYELKGMLVFEDGTPVAGGSVVLTGARMWQVTMPVRTAADGSFSIPIFEGQSYTVRASYNFPDSKPLRQAQGQTTLRVSGEPAPIRLVLLVR